MAARWMQARWRGKSARRRVAQLRAEREHILKEQSAIIIQSTYRARKELRRLRRQRHELMIQGAAILIQNIFRGNLARMTVKNVIENKIHASKFNILYFIL